ncbi:hypothetical protein ACKU5W_002060 [Klebsiella pneumoniae]
MHIFSSLLKPAQRKKPVIAAKAMTINIDPELIFSTSHPVAAGLIAAPTPVSICNEKRLALLVFVFKESSIKYCTGLRRTSPSVKNIIPVTHIVKCPKDPAKSITPIIKLQLPIKNLRQRYL